LVCVDGGQGEGQRLNGAQKKSALGEPEDGWKPYYLVGMGWEKKKNWFLNV
jgi:hypothetical protein